MLCRFWLQCSRSLRCRSAAARLLISWVRIQPGAWMFVCCECCVLSVRGLCDELITRPEESYRLCCVVVCDLETSRMVAIYIYIYRVNLLDTTSWNTSCTALIPILVTATCCRSWFPFLRQMTAGTYSALGTFDRDTSNGSFFWPGDWNRYFQKSVFLSIKREYRLCPVYVHVSLELLPMYHCFSYWAGSRFC